MLGDQVITQHWSAIHQKNSAPQRYRNAEKNEVTEWVKEFSAQVVKTHFALACVSNSKVAYVCLDSHHHDG